jgi:hypothetical protein
MRKVAEGAQVVPAMRRKTTAAMMQSIMKMDIPIDT